MFFEDSRPDRKKRALKSSLMNGAVERSRQLSNSPIPPPKAVEYLTADDLMYGGDRTLTFDVESYINYWFCGFKCLASNKYLFFEITPQGYRINGVFVNYADWLRHLGFVLHRFRLVGFNSRNYDVPMIVVAMQGVEAWKLKEISNEIIFGELRAWEVEKRFACRPPQMNHIDIMEVAPLHDGLKTYAGRLHAPRMQDLPYPHDKVLTPYEMDVVRGYNVNDLDNTQLVFEHLSPHIELREELGKEYLADLRSKSDAQVAEHIIRTELEKVGVTIDKPTVHVGSKCRYKVPDWVKFKTTQFQGALDVLRYAQFEVGAGGKILLPKEVKALKLGLGVGTYKIGIGGLHSSEKSVGYVADNDTYIIDRDVASYYPRIIINGKLYPPHLGPAFLGVYERLTNLRLDYKAKGAAAKKAGDKEQAKYWTNKADGLKIAINGIFGKTGNQYSAVYSPDLVTQITITGQLGLLMQIEMLELAGFKVVSANTDGVVTLVPKARYDEFNAVIAEWERLTGFETEETRYKSVWSRDVNNYIAIKEDGECKVKGIYSERGSAQNSILSKNPETLIVSDAVQAFLSKGTPVEETIDSCRDIRRFVSIRKAAGGAEQDGVYLGKVIRWYYATNDNYGHNSGERKAIHRVSNANQIGKTEGAKPLMDLPDGMPEDLDYDWYVNEANEALYDVGYYRRAQKGRLF